MTVVLIADDDPGIRMLVHATLDQAQLIVLEAEDGDQAWELLTRHHPAVAVLDVRMPGLSGLDLAHAIKHDAALSGTHVILLSGNAEADVMFEGASNADRYLTKPFSPRSLLAAVVDAIARDTPSGARANVR